MSISLEFHLGKIPSDDPLAFMEGFMHGISGEDRGCAGEYREGYIQGRLCRLGQMEKPDYVNVPVTRVASGGSEKKVVRNASDFE